MVGSPVGGSVGLRPTVPVGYPGVRLSRNYVFRVQLTDKESARVTLTMIGKGNYTWQHNGDEYHATREAPSVWVLKRNGAALEHELLSLKCCIARCFGITRKLVQSVFV